jgi:hypothetical protein
MPVPSLSLTMLQGMPGASFQFVLSERYTMRQFWVYCLDTATGVRFFFPYAGTDVDDCRNRIAGSEILPAGVIIERIEE